MKRPLDWAAVIVVLLALLVTAVRAAGERMLSPGMSIMAANRCDPHPCWQGLRLGQITLAEAEQHLRDAGALLELSSELCWNTLSAPFWRSCASSTNDMNPIQRVVLQLPSDGLLFGDAVTLFGEPDSLEFCSVINTGRADLPRRFVAAFVTFPDNTWIMAYNRADPASRRFDPSMLVVRIAFNAERALEPPQLRWHGFTTFAVQQGTCRPQ